MDGVSSLGLSTNVLPASRAGRDLPRRLQQRVVPRRDQGADADRLVDDPADRVAALPVSTTRPASVPADAGVVAEAGDDVVHVVLGLDQALAGVQRLGAGEVLASRSMMSATRASSRPRSRSGVCRQGPVVEGRARRGDRRRGVGSACPRPRWRPGRRSAGQRISRVPPVHGRHATCRRCTAGSHVAPWLRHTQFRLGRPYARHACQGCQWPAPAAPRSRDLTVTPAGT